MSDKPSTTRNRFFGPFLWVVTGAGCLAFFYSFLRLDLTQIDSRFAVLVAMALMLTSRITVPIPRLSSQISVSDTFVFLVLLLYGAPAAIIVAAVAIACLRGRRARPSFVSGRLRHKQSAPPIPAATAAIIRAPGRVDRLQWRSPWLRRRACRSTSRGGGEFVRGSGGPRVQPRRICR